MRRDSPFFTKSHEAHETPEGFVILVFIVWS
jgi:hypothetical protein